MARALIPGSNAAEATDGFDVPPSHDPPLPLLRTPLTFAYRFVFAFVSWLWGVDLSCTVRLGQRVRIWHHGGTVLGTRATGDDVPIRRNTTLGLLSRANPIGKPIVGNRCVAAATRIRSVAALLLAGAACGSATSDSDVRGDSKAMEQQLTADLTVVRNGRMLFSHHSVGANIISGIERLDEEVGGGRLRIATPEEAQSGAPALIHVSGGSNKDPKSKIDFFAATIRNEPRVRPNLAFMKLCFVDFEPRTDIDDLFSYYQRTMEALKREHPEIRFAHVTVPLFKRPTDVKQSLRRLLGFEVWEDAANAKRSEFNRRLMESFPGDPVFDLARAEATGPDGRLSTFKRDAGTYLSLNSRYTDDGGHLNASGQRVAGAAAIRFLAEALRSRGAVH